jgi:threonine dehydratase
LRTNLGKLPFEILREHLKPDDVILVSEDEIIRACQLVLERMKVVIEPSSATVVAALLKDERFKGKRVCCVLSGGNIDMASLFDFLRTQIKE